MLLRNGDYIDRVKSHQHTLAQLLNYHVSWKGLRAKVFPRGPLSLFPTGAEYHGFKGAMKSWMLSPQKPIIFHMSWTDSKVNKIHYFDQMGEWYISSSSDDDKNTCLQTPQPHCHFRDMPSIIYCGMMDPVRERRKSFWRDEQEVSEITQRYAISES